MPTRFLDWTHHRDGVPRLLIQSYVPTVFEYHGHGAPQPPRGRLYIFPTLRPGHLGLVSPYGPRVPLVNARVPDLCRPEDLRLSPMAWGDLDYFPCHLRERTLLCLPIFRKTQFYLSRFRGIYPRSRRSVPVSPVWHRLLRGYRVGAQTDPY
jgi:hypothetical protein